MAKNTILIMVELLIVWSLSALPASGAISQSDLVGHWSGTLTDSTGQTVYALDFTVDSSGIMTGTGDNRPLATSTLTVKDAAAGTVGGKIHWFYIDTGVNFDLSAGVPVSSLETSLRINGPVDGQFYVAPQPAHSTGTWTLDISGGMGSTGGPPPVVNPPGPISFVVKAGAESKSNFSALISVADVAGHLPKGPSGNPTLRGLNSLTLTIGSATFPVTFAVPRADAKLIKSNLVLTLRGLNLIELLSVDLKTPIQVVATSINISAIDAAGDTITFFNSSINFAVTIKHDTAKGTRAKN